MPVRPSPRPLAPRRSLLLVLLVVAALGAPQLPVHASGPPTTLFEARAVGSGPVVPGFPIGHLGIRFDGEPQGHVVVRFRHAGRWSGWTEVHEDGAQQADRWTGALVAGHDADAYQVRGVPSGAKGAVAAAINTTDGPPSGRPVPATRADAASPCRSRADWGADESLRTGTPQHGALQLLTVHHTATSTADATADPSAVVRAIYSWHTQGNGWADIGYQALVAPDGTWFEGRWSGAPSPSCAAGGDGSSFGQTSGAPGAGVVTGAHAAGHNTGNFGIALLGTYSSAAPSAAARATLVERLAMLARQHGRDPHATVAYDNGVNAGSFAQISGHRDIVATDCPGGVLYADLPAIRDDVAAALAPPAPAPAAIAVTVAETPVAGTVDGTHAQTHALDGHVQRITEVASSGKPSRRHALLEHVWQVDVGTASGRSLLLGASMTSSPERDGVRVQVATATGSWTTVATVPAGGAVTAEVALPAGLSGVVRVRAVDTVRVAGEAARGTFTVDRLAIRTG